MKHSSTVQKILKNGKGYRCESISSGKHDPSDVARYEIEELGNDNDEALAQYCDGLGLPKKNCSFTTIYWILETEYDGKYNALWLTTKTLAKKRYCDPDEQPVGHFIPPGSKVIQDLDDEGGLFLLKKRR